ncbi:amino acid adenylation domain-containing protein [Xanthomonas fragariae]|uniref:non-ribosomal peptide synthetase n=1 Tax=Xanthomonas fragariae TaxID=48664 RepID=UPI002ED2CC1C
MLPLVELTQQQIDRIVATVPGGVSNVQDIYPLAPLQEGMLYHHLSATQGDPYLLQAQFAFSDQERLHAFITALQQVIDRHDILRSSIVWEELDTPVQVVWRQATLPMEQVDCDPENGAIIEQLQQRFGARKHALNLQCAPLLKLVYARDPANLRWAGMLLFHHLVLDHFALQTLRYELQVCLLGNADTLPAQKPYRAYVMQARLGSRDQEHRDFFEQRLRDVDEPTLPFGLRDQQSDGNTIEESSLSVMPDLSRRLRRQARLLGISAASLHHLAWAHVLGCTCTRDDVVFGTVLLGRMQGNAETTLALGMSINTLPLRVQLDRPVLAAARKVHEELIALLAHEHVSLALAQRCSGVAAPAPLFSALLNYRHTSPTDEFAEDAVWQGIDVLHAEERTNYALTLNVDDLGVGFRLTAQVSPAVGAARVCSYMHTALASVVDALERTPYQRVCELPILSDAEFKQLVVECNTPCMEPATGPLLHQIFESQAAVRPDAVAVEFEQTQLSYAQLNQRANQLAHCLLELGVRPDDRVALCIERGCELLIGMLGILKVGAAYVPLDPASPQDRLTFTLSDSAPVALVTDTRSNEVLPQVTCPKLCIDASENNPLTAQPLHNPQIAGLAPEHLAYVIYTSGSSGKPKGVLVEHRNVTRLFTATHAWFDFNAHDTWALFHSFAFDFSVWEIWGALLHGGRLLVVPQQITRSPKECYALLCQVGVTVLNQTPSAFRQLIAAQETQTQAHCLRVVIFGGEALEPGMLKPWYGMPQNAATQLVNMYGITETTVHVTYYSLSPTDAQSSGVSPIGRRIPDLRLYVLDAQRRPVPSGVMGELYVGGAGVARGYLNRPELTAERFIDDPFHPGARLYKSGDLARWRPDGNLEYLGRNDEQVKIRGFRIELGEIQVRLTEHQDIRDAIIVARADDHGHKQLVAYVIATDPLSVPSADVLRQHLLTVLADYMVPSAFVMLESWPLTLNGKLDLKALPAPDADAHARQDYAAPQGEVEQLLAKLWSDVLQVEQVGRHDNFFALGGHSLLAVTLIERMRRHGLGTDVRLLFGQPTVAAIAAVVGNGQEVAVPQNLIPLHCERITPALLPLVELPQAVIDQIVASVPGGARNVQDIYPLAPLQEGILYHHLAAHFGDPYLLQSQFAFANRARLHAFVAALQHVIDRHDILRTAIFWEGLDQPVQVVVRDAQLVVEEVVHDPAQGEIARQLRSRFDARVYRLALGQAPLLRLVIAEDIATQQMAGTLLFHHIVLDHLALDVVREEMQALLSGAADALPAAIPYRNYVAQVRLGTAQATHTSFFARMLGDVEEPTLPFGLQNVQGDGSGIEQAELRLSAALSAGLRAQAKKAGISVASLHHLAYARVLSVLSGREDVVFGTVLLGRMQSGAGADRALGVFINTLPLRGNLLGIDVQAAVAQMHASLSALLVHEHASLALAQRCSRIAAPTPLFSALLNYRHTSVGYQAEADTSAWHGITFIESEERTNYPTVLSVDDLGDGFHLTAQVSAVGAADRLCTYMQVALTQLVEALEQTPDRPICQLCVVPCDERQRLLGFNATQMPAESHRTIPAMFERQAASTPDAIAVECGHKQLRYAELNARANALADQLITQGVVPDDRVAICVQRSPELLVGLLAILKAGAAYVPLDPSYPSERLRYLLQDSAPRAVLRHAATREVLSGDVLSALPLPLPAIDIDFVNASDLGTPNPVVAGLDPAHLAYVIYTSGSTGQPKGVMVEHRQLAQLIDWHCTTFGVQAGSRTSSVAGLSFDAAAWEIWPTLCAGGCLLMPAGDNDVDALLRWWHAQELDVSFLPTPIAEHAFASGIMPKRLTHLLVGGDRLRQVPAGLPFAVHNNYGPTETTVVATSSEVVPETLHPSIGTPLPHLRAYVLDAQRQLTPLGVVGELYLGGMAVARGYLGREALTAERFIDDPLHPGERMYRTGDLCRWLEDGSLDYVGRNDAQVKIRGRRIELGEIEVHLLAHAQVREAVVLAREDVAGDKRLVAYVIAQDAQQVPMAEVLSDDLRSVLADYMVPEAFVFLDAWPLTPNGKLDCKALPMPDAAARSLQCYEPPADALEQTLAEIWQSVLGVERVGRHDNFFQLGGHSLLAVTLVERMRQHGLSTDVRVLFGQSTLAALAAAVGNELEVEVPANLIPQDCQRITPELLTLVQLSQDAIDRIVATVPGGAANVQDIYPLAPLQEGVLYHYLAARQGDPYLLQGRLAFDSEARLQAFAALLQRVIDRHDILRTSVVWEGLDAPMQVVWRRAKLRCKQISANLEQSDVLAQLQSHFDASHHRLNLTVAPLLQLHYAADPQQHRVVAILLFHHLALDHQALGVLRSEMEALYATDASVLPTAIPYRNYVAQALLGKTNEEHAAFFRQRLQDIEQPTLPFAVGNFPQDGEPLQESNARLDLALSRRLRKRARALNLSVASLHHLAWGMVLGATSGRDDVVSGTVLLGRMQGGAGVGRAMGMFINTLPIRIRLDQMVALAARATHSELTALLAHEHAPLTLAQRCSGVTGSIPLFSALLNYRHSADIGASSSTHGAWDGVQPLGSTERTNYPLTLNVDDLGEQFALTVQATAEISAPRICTYMQVALTQLVEALEQTPDRPIGQLCVLPDSERECILKTFNATTRDYPQTQTIHALFEQQVARHPDAVAVVDGARQYSYATLNCCANRLAHHLIESGVRPGDHVAICLPRSMELLVAQLAITKCAAAYLPLDVQAPQERLRVMLQDSGARWVVSHRTQTLPDAIERLDLDMLDLSQVAEHNPQLPQSSGEVAYLMYTSGSTGQPKGVRVPHRAISRLVRNNGYAEFLASDRVAFAANPAFDASTLEVWAPLLNGACLVVVEQSVLLSPQRFQQLLHAEEVTVLWLTAGVFHQYAQALLPVFPQLRYLIVGGDVLDPTVIARVLEEGAPQVLLNGYGPTETTTFATTHRITEVSASSIPIGRPIGNTQVYVLDAQRKPMPIGVVGELYIGGDGVALGYLNRPEQTAERFVPNPFSTESTARMYRTGDLVRWQADGTLEYLGRNDGQIKIRGFRIELGEIEAALRTHPAIADAAVVQREDVAGAKQLVAYYSIDASTATVPSAQALRSHLQAQLPDYMLPAAYVALEQLPLTPNGKLDRKALPMPTPEASVSHGEDEPEGELEQLLASLWAQLLQLERIGRHDDFFELGGHSLLVVRLSGLLEQAQLTIPLGELLQHSTLAAMAAAIQRYQRDRPDLHTPHTSAVVAVRAAGTQRPLFLVHDFTGLDLYFSALGQHIAPDVPIYGLSAIPLGEFQPCTVEELATRLLANLRTVQAHGPYRIAGWSFGGLLAYEMATQLVSCDEQVEFVGLIDTYHPTQVDLGPAFRVPELTQRYLLLQHCLAATSEHDDPQLSTHCLTALIEQVQQWELEALIALCHLRNWLPKQWAGHSDTALLNYLAREAGHGHAHRHYVPMPVTTPIHLFTANDVLPTRSSSDAALGWQSLLPAPMLKLVVVPGDHHTMLEQPYVAVLGAALSSAMDTASRLPAHRQRKHLPLTCIHKGLPTQTPVICVPGAGANVAGFVDLSSALGESWPVYGLQPRGLEGEQLPYGSVEVAAQAYVRALAQALPDRTVHLLGHSFGGWVAYEMACMLSARGFAVASLTLIDCEVLGGDGMAGKPYTATAVLECLIKLLQVDSGVDFGISLETFRYMDNAAQLQAVHAGMVRAGLLPRRSVPEAIRGMVQVFGMALRTAYTPAARFGGPLRLVLADDPLLDAEQNRLEHHAKSVAWKALAPQLRVWRGPGDHFTALRVPHVQHLVRWWMQTMEVERQDQSQTELLRP